MIQISCMVCKELVEANENCGCFSCDNCCTYVHYPKARVKYVKSAVEFHEPKEDQFDFNKSNRFISVEIEVSNIELGYIDRIHEVVKKWSASVTSDTSLPKTGFKIITAPAAGDLFVQQVFEICEVLNEAKPDVWPTCTLHVNVDVTDFGFDDINRLVIVYAAIEPTLMDMVSPKRRVSPFHMRCGKFYRNLGTIDNRGFNTIVNEGLEQIISEANESNFNALNLSKFFSRGLIESRLFNGTTNPNKIVGWGILWATIIDYVQSFSGKSEDLLCLDIDPFYSYKSLMNIVRSRGTLSLEEFVDHRIEFCKKES